MKCTPIQLESRHWQCPRCGYTSKRPLDAPFHAECMLSGERPQPPTKRISGVGDHLKAILTTLNLTEKPGCGCGATRKEMNDLGPDGCRREIDRLADKLRENAESYSIWEAAIAAWNLAGSGLAINPLDPYRSLILIAIERCEAATVAANQSSTT